jgi:hypothetical protein
MKIIKNFFLYFLTALLIMGIVYGFVVFLSYLVDQSWGPIGLALLFATMIGIAGIIKGND